MFSRSSEGTRVTGPLGGMRLDAVAFRSASPPGSANPLAHAFGSYETFEAILGGLADGLGPIDGPKGRPEARAPPPPHGESGPTTAAPADHAEVATDIHKAETVRRAAASPAAPSLACDDPLDAFDDDDFDAAVEVADAGDGASPAAVPLPPWPLPSPPSPRALGRSPRRYRRFLELQRLVQQAPAPVGSLEAILQKLADRRVGRSAQTGVDWRDASHERRCTQIHLEAGRLAGERRKAAAAFALAGAAFRPPFLGERAGGGARGRRGRSPRSSARHRRGPPPLAGLWRLVRRGRRGGKRGRPRRTSLRRRKHPRRRARRGLAGLRQRRPAAELRPAELWRRGD
ncbi:hypothetical protein M885DRAFT_343899 [Pelagophyceae sp. CCMP2097]|nr:hypothetical protein M885DRAFT_343899 [Pelagophyceae sp. CCMP2097]